MVVTVKHPINVHFDSVGDIFLSENTLISQCTKDIKMHHQFIRDYIEGEIVKIQFLRSEENLADPFTKNLSNRPFEVSHIKVYIP